MELLNKIMNKKLKTALKAIAVVILLGFFAVALYFGFLYFAMKNSIKTYEEQKKDIFLPCEPANYVDLGSPYLYYGIKTPGAEFTTDGSDIYIAAHHIGGTSLDTAFNSTIIYIGNASDFSESEFRHEIEKSDLAKKIIIDQKYNERLSLPSGRYRLWVTYGNNVVVYSCEEGGVSDPKPVW